MRTIILSKTDSVAEAFYLPRGVTSIVGGGGKTTLMLRLAEELGESGARVIVTTTTHIFPPEGILTFSGASKSEIEAALAARHIVCLGVPAEQGKLSMPETTFAEMEELADYVLVEADGAKHLPLKAPAPHEPVIPPETKMVLAVAGMDGAGKTIEETAFRPGLYAALLESDEAHRITPADIARVLTHDGGQRKGVSGRMRYAVLLNKADDEQSKGAAIETAMQMDPARVDRVVIGSLGGAEERGITFS